MNNTGDSYTAGFEDKFICGLHRILNLNYYYNCIGSSLAMMRMCVKSPRTTIGTTTTGLILNLDFLTGFPR